jgi:hypothetical protein
MERRSACALHGFAAAESRAYLIHGLTVTVVLQRKILGPDERVFRIVRQFDLAIKRVLRFLFALDDVDQQGQPGDSGQSSHGDDDAEFENGALAR